MLRNVTSAHERLSLAGFLQEIERTIFIIQGAHSKFALCGQNRKFGVRISYKAFVLADKSFSENPHSANLRNVTGKAKKTAEPYYKQTDFK
jgi:hypothetical protein